MALPTLAQYCDGVKKITTHPELGLLYAQEAHVFRAFGLPRVLDSALKILWSAGATADYAGVTAGIPQGTVAPAQVSDTFNLDMALIGSQGYSDIPSQAMGGAYTAEQSLKAATEAIYRKFVAGILGTADGDDLELWGIENFVDESSVITAGMVNETAGVSGILLDRIDEAITALPQAGYNICLCDNSAMNAVKRDIRKSGGAAPVDLMDKNFGAQVLTYSGCSFFATDQATTQVFAFYNVGSSSGCELVIPATGLWVAKTKSPEGYAHDVVDMFLQCQLVFKSPRAAFKSIINTDYAG